jgi:hypothetical protein
MFQQFLALSSEVTAFSRFELQGTGQAQLYFDTVIGVVGRAGFDELLQTYSRVTRDEGRGDRREAELRKNVFGHEKLGPIARNIIKMWYSGVWYQLPRAWTDAYGAHATGATRTVTGDAYVEGLLWRAIGAHPPGARPPGYASWSGPPEIPPCSCDRHRATPAHD